MWRHIVRMEGVLTHASDILLCSIFILFQTFQLRICPAGMNKNCSGGEICCMHLSTDENKYNSQSNAASRTWTGMFNLQPGWELHRRHPAAAQQIGCLWAHCNASRATPCHVKNMGGLSRAEIANERHCTISVVSICLIFTSRAFLRLGV